MEAMADSAYKAPHPSIDYGSLRCIRICHLLFVPATAGSFLRGW
jgi:hypothetical protein